jgi:RimJ/RimL family protein N-acetyltransferase
MTKPELHTERLLLRPTALEDFERWAELIADPEVARFIGGAQPRALAWRSFLTMAGAWSLTGVAMFSVIEKATGRWIGRVGPWQPEGWPGSEVGWSLCRDAWGKGYAVEAASAAMDYAVDTLGWTDIIHSIDPANAPSQRVAQSLGSTLRGRCQLPAPHENAPCELWAQTAEEWRARRNELRRG